MANPFIEWHSQTHPLSSIRGPAQEAWLAGMDCCIALARNGAQDLTLAEVLSLMESVRKEISGEQDN